MGWWTFCSHSPHPCTCRLWPKPDWAGAMASLCHKKVWCVLLQRIRYIINYILIWIDFLLLLIIFEKVTWPLISNCSYLHAQMQQNNWRIQQKTALRAAAATICLLLKQQTILRQHNLHLPFSLFLQSPHLMKTWSKRQNRPALLAVHTALLEVRGSAIENFILSCQYYAKKHK